MFIFKLKIIIKNEIYFLFLYLQTLIFLKCISILYFIVNSPVLIKATTNYNFFCFKYKKPFLLLSIAFTEFFISPSFMCNGGKNIFSGSTNGGFLIFFCPGVRDCLLGQPCLIKKIFRFLLSQSRIKQKYFVYSSFNR